MQFCIDGNTGHAAPDKFSGAPPEKRVSGSEITTLNEMSLDRCQMVTSSTKYQHDRPVVTIFKMLTGFPFNLRVL
jgi:hypothetical protein